jgi:exodeoxyribonuclease VII large subunit
VADGAIVRRRSSLEAAAAAAPRSILARLLAARSTLDAAASALAVLDPQATLERGYAIVRRTVDERILRDPAEAPAGTPLAIRLAAGELPATAGDAGAGG